MVCLYLRFKGVHMPWASCLRAENFQLVYLFSQKKKNILTVVLVLFHIVELEVKKLERHVLSVPTCMHGKRFQPVARDPTSITF
jgi:hypothetical protein